MSKSQRWRLRNRTIRTETQARQFVEAVLAEAARHWEDGYPHRAWEVMADAGLDHEYPRFVRVATSRARRTYLARTQHQ